MKQIFSQGVEILDLSTAKIMAIINLNADSFYAASRKQNQKEILQTALNALQDGSSILDLGACSSRPGAEIPDAKTEWERLKPALEIIREHLPQAIISLDTFRAEIVEKAMEFNIQLVNDISAGEQDETLWASVASHNLAYAMMHMRGKPENMQSLTNYPDGVCAELLNFFSKKLKEIEEIGIDNCIIDPGFGFAKTVQQNYELLKELPQLKSLHKPILVGLSRKSMLYKPLGITADSALNATTAAHLIALQKGAKILRVHDVRAAAEAIKIFTFAENPGTCFS